MLAERREHSLSEVPAREDVEIEVWPHWLGDEARPLAAFTHLPKSGWRDTGVVLCNPFGIELLSSRRAYRHLADRLARAGVPALRFDYDGTGDSAGTDEDPNRVEAWLASIGRAIDELRRVSGARRVVLFGVRLGALLARAYAAQAPVDGLVLVACPATGRAHVREMKSLESLRKGRAENETRPDGEQLSGFFLSHETAAALGALDLGSLPLAGPVDALVLSSDDASTREERIVASLSAGEASVTRSKTPGYADMMRDDPYKSIVPDALWSEVIEWVHARSSSSPGPSARGRVRTDAQIRVGAGVLVREEVVSFDGMTGVLTEPIGSVPNDRPTVFLLNIGANHHIGSGRIYVSLARDWASQGFRVLRFDRSGLGDSPARPGAVDNYVFAPYGVDETQKAMSFLARTKGARTFVLGGVCSGAYYAYHSAVADVRVVGVIIMNLPTFHWKDGDSLDARYRATFRSSRFYARAAIEPETLLRVLRGKVDVSGIVRALASRAVAASVAGLKSMLNLDPILKSFRSLDARNVSVLLLFSDTDAGVDLVETHLGIQASRMRRASHFSMRLVSGAGHTFLNAKAQHMLHGVLGEHLESRFGPRQPRR